MSLFSFAFFLQIPQTIKNYQFGAKSDFQIIKILCIGESTTADLFSDDSNRAWPRQLGFKLNEIYKDRKVKFVVINEAVPAVSTEYLLNHLPAQISKHEPDIVISMMGINDGLEIDRNIGLRKYPFFKRLFELKTFKIYFYIKENYFTEPLPDYVSPIYKDITLDNFDKNFENMILTEKLNLKDITELKKTISHQADEKTLNVYLASELYDTALFMEQNKKFKLSNQLKTLCLQHVSESTNHKLNDPYLLFFNLLCAEGNRAKSNMALEAILKSTLEPKEQLSLAVSYIATNQFAFNRENVKKLKHKYQDIWSINEEFKIKTLKKILMQKLEGPVEGLFFSVHRDILNKLILHRWLNLVKNPKVKLEDILDFEHNLKKVFHRKDDVIPLILEKLYLLNKRDRQELSYEVGMPVAEYSQLCVDYIMWHIEKITLGKEIIPLLMHCSFTNRDQQDEREVEKVLTYFKNNQPIDSEMNRSIMKYVKRVDPVLYESFYEGNPPELSKLNFQSTRNNHRSVAELLLLNNIKYIVMSYPTTKKENFKNFFSKNPSQVQSMTQLMYAEHIDVNIELKYKNILFVSNDNFSDECKFEIGDCYIDLFTKLIGGKFGHTTDKGHGMIAENIVRLFKNNEPYLLNLAK